MGASSSATRGFGPPRRQRLFKRTPLRSFREKIQDMPNQKRTKPSSDKAVKRRAPAPRHSEDIYRQIVDGVTDYELIMLDPQGNILTWNKGAERLKGYRPEEVIGQHFSRFYTEEDRAAVQMHDIGLYLTKNAAGETGFQVLVGGGLGRTPIIGQVIREFVAPRDLLSYLEAILRVYNLEGRRDNLTKARIKILVKALGIDEFRKRVDAEWAEIRESGLVLDDAEIERVRAFFTPPAYEADAAADTSWIAQRDADPAFARWLKRNTAGHKVAGYRNVFVALKPFGQAPGDITAEQMDAVADLADRYSFGQLRSTHTQNLILADVRNADLHALWQARELTVVHAAGLPYRERSHFDAQQVLESGGSRPYELTDGWLGRALRSSGVPGIGGLALGASVPLVLRGSEVVDSWAPSTLSEPPPDLLNRLQQLYGDDAALGQALQRARMLHGEPAAMTASGGMAGGTTPPRATVALAQRAGEFLSQPSGPRVAVLDIGGWDTHAAQARILASQLGLLDDTLAALRQSLVAGGAWPHTVVVVATEFGRQVSINGTGGTDHGSGGAAFLLGGAVQGRPGGRVLADWPGLAETQRYEGRDLRITTDLRSVLRPLLAEHLKISTAALDRQVLPGSGGLARVQGELLRGGVGV